MEKVKLSKSLPKVNMSLPGPKAKKILDKRTQSIPSAVLCNYPVVMDKAEGAIIQDVDGNRFLDWVGGVGVMNVGYSQPEVIDAVDKQSHRFFHSMVNITTNEQYVNLASRLDKLAPIKGSSAKTMFVNSGAETIENAVKIAKSYTHRSNIIVFSGAFHGRTALTVTMTAKKAYSYGLEPDMGGIFRTEFPYMYRAPEGLTHKEAIKYYLDKLKTVFEQGVPPEFVAGVVIEPIQGEGGFIPAPFEYVSALRKICDKYGILLIADEVQTGFARSGKLFVSNYWKERGFAPDIISCAKSIAGGLPLAAVIGNNKIMEGIRPGIVGSTFGGNPIACAAGLKVLDIIKRDKLTLRALHIGKLVTDGFKKFKDKYNVIGDVRGIGSFVGVEFVKNKKTKEPYPELVSKMIKKAVNSGLIIENAGVHNNIIRFLCPLVASDKQIKIGLKIYEEALKSSLTELV